MPGSLGAWMAEGRGEVQADAASEEPVPEDQPRDKAAV